MAARAKHAANRKDGLNSNGADALSQAAEKPRQRVTARDRKASAAAPSGLTEVDPFGLTTLAAASAAVEQHSKAANKAPAKPARVQSARPQEASRSSAAAIRSKGSKKQSDVMQALCSKQDEGGEGQTKRGREPEEQDARPTRSKARKGGHGSTPRAAGGAEIQNAAEDLSLCRRPPNEAAEGEVAMEATTGRKRPRKPARKPAAATPQVSGSGYHYSPDWS